MALREINLVPFDVVRSRYVRRHLFVWALSLACLISLIFGYYYYQTRFALTEGRQTAQLQATQANLRRRIDQINEIQEKLHSIAQEQAVMAAIAIGQPYSRIMSRLSAVMNADTWLQQLTIDSGGGRGSSLRLQMKGSSTTNDVLGDFLNQLAMEPMFERFTLKYAREEDAPGSDPGTRGKKIGFMIECSIPER